MPIIGVQVDDEKVVKNFFKGVDSRIKLLDIVRSPFNGMVKKGLFDGKSYYVIDVDPVFPHVFWFGVFMFYGALLLTGFTLWLLPGIVLFSFGFFFSKPFFMINLYIGLRKSGYHGKIKLLSDGELIKRLFYGTNRGL